MRSAQLGVFDERRYFEPGTEPALIEIDGTLVGLTVCEDIWHPSSPEGDEVAAGARLVVNSSASPYHRGTSSAREAMVARPRHRQRGRLRLCTRSRTCTSTVVQFAPTITSTGQALVLYFTAFPMKYVENLLDKARDAERQRRRRRALGGSRDSIWLMVAQADGSRARRSERVRRLEIALEMFGPRAISEDHQVFHERSQPLGFVGDVIQGLAPLELRRHGHVSSQQVPVTADRS